MRGELEENSEEISRVALLDIELGINNKLSLANISLDTLHCRGLIYFNVLMQKNVKPNV